MKTVILIVSSVLVAAWISIPIVASCSAVQPSHDLIEYVKVSDMPLSEKPDIRAHLNPDPVTESEPQPEVETGEDYEYYEPVYYDGPSYTRGNPDGLNSFTGINEFNGTTETYYSSNVAYHYRTDEWTTDDQGFYRTDEGYYVVASNDYAEGTIIETSQGDAIVLDSGTDSGVVDFYVNW